MVLVAAIAIAAVLTGATTAGAQGFTAWFTAILDAASVVPPIAIPAGAKAPAGLAVIKVTRVSSTTAPLDVHAAVTGLPTTDVVTDLVVNQGGPGTNGTTVGFSDITNVSLSGGDTTFSKDNGSVASPSMANQILDNPQNFHVLVKTASRPGGALRGQLTRDVAFDGLGMKIFTNAGTYAPGDQLDVKLFLGNLSMPFTLDLFTRLVLSPETSAFICPPGIPALVFIGAGFTVEVQCLNAIVSVPKFQTIDVQPGPPVQTRLLWQVPEFPELPGGTHRPFVCYQNPNAPAAQPVCDTTAFATNP
jgi:hypothetical protein